jgi:Protein of unknown function (DUF1153)
MKSSLESEVTQALPKSRNPRGLNTDRLTEEEILMCTNGTAVDLPPTDTKRWVARRKAAVVSAVRSGAIGLEEACRRYELSEEEFHTWERGIENHGVPGLRITRLQIYYDAPRLRPVKPRIEHQSPEKRRSEAL